MAYLYNRVCYIIKISLSFAFFALVLLEEKENSHVKGSYANLMVGNDITKEKV